MTKATEFMHFSKDEEFAYYQVTRYPSGNNRLNVIMEFGHVIRVIHVGAGVRKRVLVIDEPDTWAPDLYMDVDSDGQVTSTDDELRNMAKPWELMDGYSSQYRYSGPVMHRSEFIGGRMEADILAKPGVYVVVEPYPLGESEEQEQELSDEPIGWVVCRKLDRRARA